MSAGARVPITAQARLEFARRSHAHRIAKRLKHGAIVGLLPPALAWVIAAGTTSVLDGFQVAFACLITLICLTGGGFMIGYAIRDRRLPLFVHTGDHTHDPYEAVPALMALIDEIKSPVSTPRRRQARFDAACEAMQRTAGNNPLPLLVRRGYYPSRPQQEYEGGSRVALNLDKDGPQAHWDRSVEAISHLQILLASNPDEPMTWRRVLKALAEVVPPLRAVSRNAGIDTHVIEYMPDNFSPVATAPAASAQPARAQPLKPVAPVVTEDEPEQAFDALTPVEGRMNAAAAMTTATIRMLMLSYNAAEADMFVGDDQNTGRQIVNRQLPALVRLYVISHDAAIGAERDDVRADFARSLAVVRDSLEQIMGRYARNARDIMLTETRYMATRYGDADPLGPQSTAAAAPPTA